MKFFSRSRLIHLLIAKSIIEALFAGSIAVGAYLTTTDPDLKGWLDQADSQTISGWAVDESQPQRRVDVQLFIDGRFIENRTAADFRPDVHQAQRADDDWHGFAFRTPPLAPGDHEARVYIIHRGASEARRTLQIIGKPLRFAIAGASSTP